LKKIFFGLALLFFICSINAWSGTVDLIAIGDSTTWSGTPYRWMDIADYEYRSSYQTDFNYELPAVTITYNDTSNTFSGTLSATLPTAGLKPNFAYQMKLVGNSDIDVWTNEQIGSAGRWWYTQYDSGGEILAQGNKDGDNGDAFYKLYKNDSSYVFQGYLLFDFFVTDENGNATSNFFADSSYHVLYKTLQRPWTESDGPIKTTTFDPSEGTFYDKDYSSASVGIFAQGQSERALPGQLVLAPGEYKCEFILTEESFHQSGLGGGWAGAMGEDVRFTVVPIPASIYLFAGGLIGLIGIRRRKQD